MDLKDGPLREVGENAHAVVAKRAVIVKKNLNMTFQMTRSMISFYERLEVLWRSVECQRIRHPISILPTEPSKRFRMTECMSSSVRFPIPNRKPPPPSKFHFFTKARKKQSHSTSTVDLICLTKKERPLILLFKL